MEVHLTKDDMREQGTQTGNLAPYFWRHRQELNVRQYR